MNTDDVWYLSGVTPFFFSGHLTMSSYVFGPTIVGSDEEANSSIEASLLLALDC